MYGAGCWAQREVACSASGWSIRRNKAFGIDFGQGAGEHITRTALARSVGETFMVSEDADPHDILHHTLVEKFWSTHVCSSY